MRVEKAKAGNREKTACIEHDPVNRIIRSSQAIVRRRPAYTAILGFYGQVFAAQESCTADLSFPASAMAPLRPSETGSRLPLIDPSAFPVDADLGRALFGDIIRIGAETDAPISEDARRLQGRLDETALDVRRLIGGFVSAKDRTVADTAVRLSVSEDVLRLFLYHAVRPSLCRVSKDLAASVTMPLDWTRGHCPVCGTPAVLAILDAKGLRHLVCGFCWHQWPSRRLYCPFCERVAPDRSAYLRIEEEKEYRIDVCDQCRTYIKTVDQRQMDRPLYPPLESVATIHLDMTAREAGYDRSHIFQGRSAPEIDNGR